MSKLIFKSLSFLSILLLLSACTGSLTTLNNPDGDTDSDKDSSESVEEDIEGSLPDGDATDGDATDGDATDGDATDGDTTDGDATDGDATDGDTTDGDATDGDVIDGDTIDGDTTDGDATDGDATDGDATDGDATDGDASSLCADNNECSKSQYCLFDDCNDAQGVCTPRPTNCTNVHDPVCGCDDATYKNACIAAQQGISVDYEGACIPVVCSDNDDCAENKFCDKPFGDCDEDGICKVQPLAEDCFSVLNPVCGCDGINYNDDCLANAAGTTVDFEGACEDACQTNDDCGNSDYCQKPNGECDDGGVCKTMPLTCPLIFAPICACDGAGYDNNCWAAKARTSVDYDGPCIVPDGDVDTDSDSDIEGESDTEQVVCAANNECEKGEYCNLETCDGVGVCEARPVACPVIYDPICGCDGTTHMNACEAALAGVSVDYEGECYCTSNADCADDDFCEKDDADCQGNGICEARPTICPVTIDPVCGCDDVSYTNACFANLAGASINYEGACIAVCDDNSDCDGADFCEKDDGDCEGDGVCETRPFTCLPIYVPVCGCDGATYGNSCEAASVGVSVDYDGECVPTSCFGNGDCKNTEYCNLGVCAAETGECTEKATICPMTYDPVCGCDAVTYDNACYASLAGMTVDYETACITK